MATTETYAPNRLYTIIALNNLKQAIEDTLASATEEKSGLCILRQLFRLQ